MAKNSSITPISSQQLIYFACIFRTSAILIHSMKNEKKKLHHKIKVIELSQLGIFC